MLETLFLPPVVTVEAASDEWHGELHPSEAAVVRRAISKRKREFTAGRVCAREALRRLGIHDYPLLSAPDRLPAWPPGIVGSISHCRDYCGVVVAREGTVLGLGVDIEPSEPLERSLLELICLESERREVMRHRDRLDYDLGRVIFSAKESVYKCYFPRVRRFLETGDLKIDLSLERGAFSVVIREDLAAEYERLGVLIGRFTVSRSHVFTGATLLGPSEALRSERAEGR